MARPASLTPWRRLALVLGLVLLLHLAGLEWAARREEQSVLATMAPPMFTRLLAPTEPPPVVAQAEPPKPKPRPRPRSAFAVKPRPKASEPRPQPAPEPPPPPPEPEPTPQVAEAPPPEPAPEQPMLPEPNLEPPAVADVPQPAASAPTAAASAPAGSEPAAWPADTRLSYRLGGEYRGGPLYGNARVQWQRLEDRYQVRLDVDIPPFLTYVMTSQGDVTPAGLLPRAYEEYRPGKRRVAQFGDDMVTFDNGKTAPRPAGMQDTVSQFVELAHRFASGQDLLEVGRTVLVPLGRPGAVDLWTYDITERVTLRTPHLGPVEAFHLKPRPMVNVRGNIYAEMWFAPSLQYLPVRIQVRMGDVDYLDLIVDKIEQ